MNQLKINKELAMLFMLSVSGADWDNDEVSDGIEYLCNKYGITGGTYFEEMDFTDKEWLKWFENTLDYLQKCIEEYEALEREE